jgi:hypothetical protein
VGDGEAKGGGNQGPLTADGKVRVGKQATLSCLVGGIQGACDHELRYHFTTSDVLDIIRYAQIRREVGADESESRQCG